ncbi:MAG: divergent PAP2 family protein [Bacilli bacterium]|nr:divergent PAP2 family protein [Bacilli bacterium]
MRSYKFVLIPFITLFLCQTIKFTIESIINKKIIWDRFFNGTGGMPSSHTSFSVSLTVLLGLNYGFDNPLFAVALVFTVIISYDAMGLRMESGKQAEAINMIVEKTIMNKKEYKKLKEKLGHKPLEVFVGYILGIVSAVVLNCIF